MGKDIIEEIYFNGGLDSDSDERFIRQGDYVDAQNMIKVEDGEGGVLVNIKGNDSGYKTTKDWTSSNICGWAYYKKNKSVILFLYGDNRGADDAMIVEWNPEASYSKEIIRDLDLAFINPATNDYFIKASINGDILAWTDNVNPPRMINIQDVKDNNPTITAAYLDLHKSSPVSTSSIKHSPPLVKLGLDDTKIYNNITGSYQFKYRYIQDDYRVTVWSPASDLAISDILTRVEDHATLTGTENYVKVTINSGNASIKFIDIAVREGNAGNWFRIVKIDKTDPENVYDSTDTTLQTSALSDDTAYVYRFFNNEGRVAVSNAEANKAYDTIPDKCETLSFIGENRLTLGGNIEGKDIDDIELNVTLTPKYEIPTIFDDLDIDATSYATVFVNVDFDLTSCFLTREKVLTGDYVYFDYDVNITRAVAGSDNAIVDGIYVTFYETLEGMDNIGNALATQINTGILGVGITASYSSNILTIIHAFASTISSIDSIAADDSIVFNRAYNYYDGSGHSYRYVNDLAFKRSTRHKLALIYHDKYGKKYPALTSTDTEIEIESYAAQTNPYATMSYEINHTAPSDAVGYRWAYAYKQKNFLQTVITDVSYFENEEGDLHTALIALDISANGQFSPFNYTIEAGDKIQIIKEGGTYAQVGAGGYVDDRPEFIVEEYKTMINDGTDDLYGIWLIVRPSNVDGYDYGSVGDPSLFMNSLIEISKEESTDVDYLFYEIGNGGYCVGGTTNHDDWYTGTKTGYLNQGDVWFRPVTRYRREASGRGSITLITILVEDPYPYKTAPLADVGIADPNIEYDESRNKYDNTIRWSNKYFQDTQVNGLSTFDFDNKKDVSDSYGKIKGLEELGNSLVVICEDKVLSSFVGATEYTDTQGNVNVVKSTSPLGYIRPHADNYGTFMKESITNTGEYIYFFDLFHGEIIRKSKNGLFPISGKISTAQGMYDYKMRTYFKDKSESLLTSLYYGSQSYSVSGVYANYEQVKCYIGYDPYYKNIYVSFLDRLTSSNSEAIIFHEPSNRWVSKYTAQFSGGATTFFPFTKHYLMSFVEGYDSAEGTLWTQNSALADRCSLYSTATDSYIQFVSHAAPNQIKIYNSLGIYTDSTYVVDPIEIVPSLNYPNGMYSKIPSTNFINQEGVQRSEFLRNMKTRSSSATNYDLINGEELRGQVVKIKMTNSDTDKIQLMKVDINSELSK